MGTISTHDRYCLTLAEHSYGRRAVVKPCDGSVKQSWILDGQFIKTKATGHCLRYSQEYAEVERLLNLGDCSNVNFFGALRWRIDGTAIKNLLHEAPLPSPLHPGERCVTREKNMATVRVCDRSWQYGQMWYFA